MSLYKQPDSEVWWINLSHNGRRVRRSSGETDRAAAQRRHDELKVELWKTEPKLRGRTWGMAVAHWCELQPRSDSELLSLAKFGRRFQDRQLADVNGDDLDKALSFCKTAGTYMRYRAMLMAILHAAIEKGWLRELPKMPVRREKKTKARMWLTREQWTALCNELPAHMKPMATFAIETGLRQANVLGLTWDRVDLKNGTVWVEGEDAKEGLGIAVPLSEGALHVLKILKLGLPTNTHGHVFTFRGKPVKEVKTAFIAACVRAGVGSYVDGRYVGFTWHGFRHTWATWHRLDGTPLDVLQKLGGWTDPRMVQTYAHFSPDYLKQFVNKRKT